MAVKSGLVLIMLQTSRPRNSIDVSYVLDKILALRTLLPLEFSVTFHGGGVYNFRKHTFHKTFQFGGVAVFISPLLHVN